MRGRGMWIRGSSGTEEQGRGSAREDPIIGRLWMHDRQAEVLLEGVEVAVAVK
jgi:hypothetical protein